MASKMVESIHAATQEAWPEVRRALDQQTTTVARLAGIAEGAYDQVEAYISSHRDGQWKRRAICAEAVWAIARLGLLRTGHEAELVRTSRLVAEDLREEIPEDERTAAEKDFLAAVEAVPDWE